MKALGLILSDNKRIQTKQNSNDNKEITVLSSDL